MDGQILLGHSNVAVVQSTVTAESITIDIVSTHAVATCPHCQQPSARRHSIAPRAIADLALGERSTILNLHVRRFRCATPACPARTFTEQLPQLVAPRRRRTVRLLHLLTQLALTTGGEAGARLTRPLHMPTSAATLRRAVRALPLPVVPTPTVLGVDDFAWRKGQTYGTILIDLTTHRPIELLPDRSADTFAAWLRAHPGVEIISRDRGGAYADGATRGAPDALQVADRFHLLQNLRDMTERVVERDLRVIHAAEAGTDDTKNVTEPGVGIQPVTAVPDDTTKQAHALPESSQRRYERVMAVQKLHAEGISIHGIVRELDLSRNTVRTYLRTTPSRKPTARRRRATLIDPFVPYLTTRWMEGCTNSAQLFREIKAQGFGGSTSIMRDWARQLRQRHPSARARRRQVSSARSLSWLLVHPAPTLTDDKQRRLGTILAASEMVKNAYPLIQAFGRMVRERQADALEPWLLAAEQSSQPDLRRFAAGLRRDQRAVTNALQFEWSNGTTEGAITRLKLIKRMGYGRASFELLRRRVLLTA